MTETQTPDLLAAELRERLREALHDCEPPLAMLLTGDVESALLCAMAAGEIATRPIAVVLDQQSLQRARLVAERIGIAQEEVVLGADFGELLGDLAEATDHPPSDPLVLQRFLAGQVVAGQSGTLVSPCGADELFGRRKGEARAASQPLRLPIAERMPYFDERVAEFALGLPQRYKSTALTTKRILRRAALPLLPGAVVHAPDRSPRLQRRFARQVTANAALWQ